MTFSVMLLRYTYDVIGYRTTDNSAGSTSYTYTPTDYNVSCMVYHETLNKDAYLVGFDNLIFLFILFSHSIFTLN